MNIKASIVLLSILGMSAFAATLKDSRDGQVYNTVTIGDQTWMAEDLRYNLGDQNYSQALELDGSIVSMFYSWKAADRACPVDWHLPSEAEWRQLMKTVGGKQAGKILKSIDPVPGAKNKVTKGADSLGFNAKLYGNLTVSPTEGPKNTTLGERLFYWSNTKVDDVTGWALVLVRNADGFGFDAKVAIKPAENENRTMMAVRCVLDSDAVLAEEVAAPVPVEEPVVEEPAPEPVVEAPTSPFENGLVDNVDNSMREWYKYDDSQSGGTSTNKKGTATTKDGNRYAILGYTLGGSVKVNKRKLKGFVGFGLNFLKDEKPIDINGCSVISYDYRGPGHKFIVESRLIKDDGFWSFKAPASEEWKTVTIEKKSLEQPSGAKPVPLEKVLSKSTGFSWQVYGSKGDTGKLSIDNVYCK